MYQSDSPTARRQVHEGEADTALTKDRKKERRRAEKKRGKRKEVASLACTHEGGAKLLQLLPAAASSLQIWGAQLAGGSPTQSRTQVRALEQSPKIDTACSVPQSHTSSSPVHPRNPPGKQASGPGPAHHPVTPLVEKRWEGAGQSPNSIPTTDIHS